MTQYLRDYLFVLGDARTRLPWMVMLLLVSAALDVFGLGLVAPLIAAITNSTDMFQGHSLSRLMLTAEGGINRNALLLFSAIVIVAFASKGLLAYAVQRSIISFSELHRRDLMVRLLKSYLTKDYEFHLGRNSTSLVNSTMYNSASYASATLAGSMRLFADAVMAFAVVSFLAWVNFNAVAVLMGALAIVFVIYDRIVKSRLQIVGSEITKAHEKVVHSLANAIGPLREVQILGVERTFTQALHHHASLLAHWNAQGSALQTVPRYLVETAMVSFIVVLGIISITQGGNPDTIMPTIGMFGVAALRLMPASTSMMSGISGLRQSRNVLSRLVEDLKSAAEPSNTPQNSGKCAAKSDGLATISEISFENVSYVYPGVTRPAVHGLTFKIKAGQAIGVIGRTGSGKSTTADLLLGLLQPCSGRILVDGIEIREDLRGWMNRLAYIPQSIFLTDDTLMRNVAFGIPDGEIDAARLENALAASQLTEVVENLPRGLDTILGERGVRLSGGQRQRVALARALYHGRQLIVMDEATAALDYETEREVVRAIATLHRKKTLFIIAHRLSTLEGCDLIFEMADGQLIRSGSFQSILGGDIESTLAIPIH